MQHPLLERWHTLLQHIEKARYGSLLAPARITLVAVSKAHPPEALIPLLEAGQHCFGENRVQEAAQKWPDLRKRFPNVILHLIGPLQSNKVKEALALFDVIETIDRESLVDEIASERTKATGRCTEFFIQVNTGEEPQKSGVAPRDLGDLLEHCRKARLPVTGLMCVPPVGTEPGQHFALLNMLAKMHGLTQLSMGMSGDFETAIRLGATHVRIGTALFGKRQ